MALCLVFIIMCSEAHWTCHLIIIAASALSSINSHLILGIYQQLSNFCSITKYKEAWKGTGIHCCSHVFHLTLGAKMFPAFSSKAARPSRQHPLPLISCCLWKDRLFQGVPWPKFICPLPNLPSKLLLVKRKAFVSISKWEIFSIPQGHKLSNKLCNYLFSYPWLELQLCKLLKKYIWKRPIFSSVNRTSVFLRELIAA